MNSMKRQKVMTLTDELPRLVGAQHATGEEWRNNSRKNEGAEPKQKQCPVVDVTGDGSKVRYCIGTWNIRLMNQGKLEVVKEEMSRVNINVLEFSEVQWTKMDEFHSDDRYIYNCGQESLRRNGVSLLVNKKYKCNIWMQSQKRNILCSFLRQTIQYHSNLSLCPKQ